MKTSELKRIVEENGYDFEKTNKFIYISGILLEVVKLDLQDQSITLRSGFKLDTQSTKKIMVALIEYSLTLLNEREDEKKYYIHQPVSNKFLNFVTLNKMYIISDSKNVEGFQIQFTQQEIDNFPAELKGAIECGFLRKVEVEWTNIKKR